MGKRKTFNQHEDRDSAELCEKTMIIQSCRSDLMTVHLKQILAGPSSTGQDGTCENPPTVLIRISPPWFLSDRNCCSSQSVSESAREMPHRWFCQLCQVDFRWLDKKHTSKDYVSSELWRPCFRATAGALFGERLQNNQNQLIPSNRDRSHFVGWFRFFLCLNDLIDPLVRSYLCCKTFAFAFGQEGRSLSYNIGRSS